MIQSPRGISRNLIFFILVIASILPACQIEPDSELVVPVEMPSAIGTNEDPNARFNYELRQLIDPGSGVIPVGIFQKEQQFVDRLNRENSRSNLRVKQEDWRFAGPFNVGGRTRALALDVLDESVIVAGGVSGNMWRSTDGGSSWQQTSHPQSINSATCLVQDIRPGRENIWYHGTGELRGNSASASAAPYRGDGIFKSTDGGQSWFQLPSTADDQLNNFNTPFRYVWNMVVNHRSDSTDEVYAAVFGGILRSADGGATWQTVLGDDLLSQVNDTTDFNGSDHPHFTDILITQSGVFYAAIGSFTSAGFQRNKSGIYRSYDGLRWTKISPVGLPNNLFRIVMATAPSNERRLYVMMDGEPSQLWQYNEAASENTTGQWTNLSQNIPDFDDRLGDYDSQGSYNMVIKLHPEDENVVFLGGTNLYRSIDGFSSSANTAWIGGYEPGGEGAPFEGHYPDQHAIVFYPSDPDRMLTGNDGGIRLTTNNRATQPTWVSLNNGFISSQFYTISLDRDGGGMINGGMQDNGSYLRSIADENVPWNKTWSGDGGYSAFTRNNLYQYYSFQNAQIFRVTFNRNTQLTSFARVDPIGGGNTPGQGYLFINPFVLDPYNNNRMYLAGGDRIWRNNNLSQIPAGENRKTEVNWESLPDTRISEGIISALEISTNPPNILYYGTVNGRLFKVENAHAPEAATTEISSSALPENAYIIRIALDPLDANHALVVLSNYNVPSLFRTMDGGNTFVNISANLEANPDGTGNGPSVRWAEIVPLQNGEYKYFAGTSRGLFSTNTELESLTWQQESIDGIGRSVVPMMDYRAMDGKLVVATHGNGVYETFVEDAQRINLELDQPTFAIGPAYPNPFQQQVRVSFSLPSQGEVFVTIFDTMGRHIKNLYNGLLYEGENAVSWDGTDTRGVAVDDGMYIVRINYEGQIQGQRVILSR